MNDPYPPSVPTQQAAVPAEAAQVRISAETARANQRLAFLAEASRLLGESLDYDTTLNQVAELVVPELADWCSVDLLEPDGTLRQVAVAHADPAKVQWALELRKKYPPNMNGLQGGPQVLHTGKSELYSEVPDEMLVAAAHDEEHLALMRQVGFSSIMIVPLRTHGRTIGVISFVAAESGQHYGNDDLLLAEDLARRAGVAVENSRLHAAERAAVAAAQKAMDRLRRLQAVTAGLSDALTVEQVAEIVVDQGLTALDANAGSIALLAADGQTIEVVRTANYDRKVTDPWKCFPVSADAPIAESIRNGTALYFRSLDELRTRYPRLVSVDTPHKAFAAVPLVVDQRLIGSLGLSFRHERKFSPEDREFAAAIARQCAQAIQRARLYEAAQAARMDAEATRERLTFLSEASTVLTVSLEYGDTLQAVARVAVPSFADYALLFLQQEDRSIRLAEITHLDPARRDELREILERYPLEPGQPRGTPLVLRTGEAELVPVFSDEVIQAHGQDPEFRRRLRAVGIRSRIVVPLRARGRTFGALALLTAESGRAYGPDDLALAEELGWRAAIALDNARLFAEIREADRRKDEFLAILAHELRNPLAPIRNSLELLPPCEPRASALDPRAVIKRQVGLMVRLVDDLLDVSRITRGKIELRKSPTLLGQVLRNAVQTSIPLIEERGHVLLTEFPEEPIWLDADATRLEQVIANLLNNAAKYTERGGVIRLSAEKAPGDEPAALVRVVDTGIGIEPEMLTRIFAPFAQADASLGREYGGLGLGLTLVQSLVRLHGGEVTACSAGVGQGSEFTIRLPLLQREAEPIVDTPPVSAEPPTTSPSRVLVVDDNVDAALTLAEILETWGCEAAVAHSGLDALAEAGARLPDMVLLDIGMPGMDGYEVARRLRQVERDHQGSEAVPTGRLQIVALTGYGQDEDRRRSREAGCDHHFTKPVDLDELRALVTAGECG